jgi:hypothetical protein
MEELMYQQAKEWERIWVLVAGKGYELRGVHTRFRKTVSINTLLVLQGMVEGRVEWVGLVQLDYFGRMLE